MIDQLVQRTTHLERTSEADQVPAAWAVAEIQRKLDAMPIDERTSAMLNGWRDNSISSTYRRTDLEVAQERAAVLASGIRPGMTPDEVADLLRSAGV